LAAFDTTLPDASNRDGDSEAARHGVPGIIFGSTASRGGGVHETGFLRAPNGATGAEL
jgi:hypothetical protein